MLGQGNRQYLELWGDSPGQNNAKRSLENTGLEEVLTGYLNLTTAKKMGWNFPRRGNEVRSAMGQDAAIPQTIKGKKALLL